MITKHKGTTIIELIIVLGIMALISMIIATLLSSTIILNDRVISANNKEYQSHEFYRYVRNSIKNFRVSNIFIEEQKISINYNPGSDESDKIEILQHNNNINLIYYYGYPGSYTRTATRIILKKINSINFRTYKNLLYIKIYWEDGEISSGIIDL